MRRFRGSVREEFEGDGIENEEIERNVNDWGERTKSENEKTKSENGGQREGEKNLEWKEDWEMQGEKRKCGSKED